MRQPRETFSHDSVREIKAPVHYLPEALMTRMLPAVLMSNLRLALSAPGAYAAAVRLAARRFRRTRRAATWRHLLQAGLLVDRWLPGSGVTQFHAHFAHSPASVAFFASRLSGLPFSFTAHAKDIYTSDPRQLREKITASRFVVTCTEYNKHHLTRLKGKAATPIFCAYHGIDIQLFAPGIPRWRPTPPYRLLTVARLTAKKGIPIVIEAFKILVDRGVDLTYTLIGDGEDRPAILDRIHATGMSERIQWLGTQPHHVVLDHYRRSDLFLIGCEIAKNGDRDGIPNVLVESLAMGVPVVATRVSAIPELVQDGATGLLVPPKDARALADAAQRLLVETDLRRTVIEGGIARVRAEFDNRKTIQPLARLFLHPAAPGADREPGTDRPAAANRPALFRFRS
jgi:glycosyltransferase involved in cell wall biosynthesis